MEVCGFCFGFTNFVPPVVDITSFLVSRKNHMNPEFPAQTGISDHV